MVPDNLSYWYWVACATAGVDREVSAHSCIVHDDQVIEDVDKVFIKSNTPQHIHYPHSEVYFAGGKRVRLHFELAWKIQDVTKTTFAGTSMFLTKWRRLPTTYEGRKHITNAQIMIVISVAAFVLSFSLTSLAAGFQNLQGFLFELPRCRSVFWPSCRPTS